jgi:hypothetical protein
MNKECKVTTSRQILTIAASKTLLRQQALPFEIKANTAVVQTLRYGGFPEFVNVLVNMGFLSDVELNFLKEPITRKEATQKILGASSSSEQDLLWAISSKTSFKDNNEKKQLIAGLTWGKKTCAPLNSPRWCYVLQGYIHLNLISAP